MNAGRDVERLIAEWLVEDSPRRAPDRVLGHAPDGIDRTKQRRLGVAWRLTPMFSNRLVIAAAIVVLVATSTLAIKQLGSIGSPRPSPTTQTESPSPSATMPLPTARQLAPSAVIDLAGMVSNTIPLATDGTDLWVGVDSAVIHVDGTTNATQRLGIPLMKTGNGGIAIVSDGLWLADFAGGRFERVDPGTGAVEVQGTVSKPHFFYVAGGDLWLGVGSSAGGVVKVDRATGAIGPALGDASIVAFGLGDIWSGVWDGVEGEHQASNLILRRSSATGATSGTISVPAGAGCAVSGAFPNNIWASCPTAFGTCPANRIAVRIDANTNAVVTMAHICGGPVAVIDGTPWFLAGRKDGADEAYSLVSADPATGQLRAQLDLGKVSPDEIVITNAALWLSDEFGQRLLRYDLAAFRT